MILQSSVVMGGDSHFQKCFLGRASDTLRTGQFEPRLDLYHFLLCIILFFFYHTFL
jgi:hypothetical protein